MQLAVVFYFIYFPQENYSNCKQRILLLNSEQWRDMQLFSVIAVLMFNASEWNLSAVAEYFFACTKIYSLHNDLYSTNNSKSKHEICSFMIKSSDVI